MLCGKRPEDPTTDWVRSEPFLYIMPSISHQLFKVTKEAVEKYWWLVFTGLIADISMRVRLSVIKVHVISHDWSVFRSFKFPQMHSFMWIVKMCTILVFGLFSSSVSAIWRLSTVNWHANLLPTSVPINHPPPAIATLYPFFPPLLFNSLSFLTDLGQAPNSFEWGEREGGETKVAQRKSRADPREGHLQG